MKPPTRRPGRPAKPPAERQHRRVVAKFTDGELAALQRAASGEPLGTYLRRLALRHLARRRK